MTSITSLLGRMPSLVDYLTKNDNTSVMSGLAVPELDTSAIAAGALGDSINLSGQAQQILAMGGTDSASAKTGAQDLITSFFKDNGVDMENLSDDAKEMLEGFAKIIERMGESVSRNFAIDAANVQGRKTYSLQADGQSLNINLKYDAKGKPVSMTLTNAVGQSATMAAITLGRDDDGKASTIEVSRSEKKYNSQGARVSTTSSSPLSVDLYAS